MLDDRIRKSAALSFGDAALMTFAASAQTIQRNIIPQHSRVEPGFPLSDSADFGVIPRT
jgi:hypothetical protein